MAAANSASLASQAIPLPSWAGPAAALAAFAAALSAFFTAVPARQRSALVLSMTTPRYLDIALSLVTGSRHNTELARKSKTLAYRSKFTVGNTAYIRQTQNG